MPIEIPMRTGQAIVLGAAAATVVVVYVRWIAECVDHYRPRFVPERDMFLLIAPIYLAALAVGLVFWSFGVGGVFAAAAFMMRPVANDIVGGLRRRRPIKPEDRQRRVEERAARRRARIGAMERYGPRMP
jgi:hypothetical protein